jgi:diaminopropionate ammonia-lyase
VKLVVVEPEAAPALYASVEAGKPVLAPGPVSCMGRLDCKEPSHLALKYLAREADAYLLVSEDEGRAAAERLGAAGMATTPSGAGGFAGLLGMPEAGMRALIYVSEGPDA